MNENTEIVKYTLNGGLFMFGEYFPALISEL